MNLHHLRAFAVVANEGNITKAARRLQTSQPAVSKQLAELEESVGTALLDRLPRGVSLTEAGKVLLRHAERIFASERAAEAELAELAGLMRGTLSIGSSTTIGGYLLPAVFGAFNRAYPRVKLELLIANTSAVHAQVLDERIDLGFTEGFVAVEQLDSKAFHHDQMVTIVSPDHFLRKRERVRCKDLTGVPFIAREEGSGTRDVIEAALRERSVEVEPVMSLGSSEAVKRAVEAGLGVAVVSRLVVEDELASNRLCLLEVEDLQIVRDLHVVKRKGKRESPAVEAFMKLLTSSLAAPAPAK
jgi:DNA-binding transcriptional LysR family regulator